MTRVAGFARRLGELWRAAPAVAALRSQAWHRLQSGAAGEFGCDAAALRDARMVLMLASASRGGSSVTSELLQWQGSAAQDPDRRLLSFPGEERPHLVLAGLAFPLRPQQHDDLGHEDASAHAATQLLGDMASEVGHPLSFSSLLPRYAVQLYRRLLLQWPLWMSQIDQTHAIRTITSALNRRFPGGYFDSPGSRRAVLDCLCSSFAFIRASFYDCADARRATDRDVLESGPWSFEEPPFVVPPPWENATPTEVRQGAVLLRDPGNAWRLPFWRAVFAERLTLLHLVREAPESIQGLCDGWLYPYGFQTGCSEDPLSIMGYSDRAEEHHWRRYRLNFSISERLARGLLAERRPMTLVEVCASQWREAHERILHECRALGLVRTSLRFSDLRRDPETMLRAACAALALEPSRSGIEYARLFDRRWVMATRIGRGGWPYARWLRSRHSREIRDSVRRWNLLGLTTRIAHGAVEGLGGTSTLVTVGEVCARA